MATGQDCGDADHCPGEKGAAVGAGQSPGHLPKHSWPADPFLGHHQPLVPTATQALQLGGESQSASWATPAYPQYSTTSLHSTISILYR